jgi:hypothetical protein
MQRLSTAFLSLLLFISGCDKNQLGSIDSKIAPPAVSTLSLTPDSIYIDNIIPSNGQYRVSTIAQARVSDINGLSDISLVFVDIVRPDGSIAFGSIQLLDDGALADSMRADGVFSGTISFTMTRSQAGKYGIRVRAIDSDGSESNSFMNRLSLTRRNAVPIMLSATTPDTVDLPSSGYVTVQFTASASDSDGLADIRQVFFHRLSPIDSSQTRFFMKDDGGLDPPVIVAGISLRSGDDIAGDGRFSFLIPVFPFPTTARRTNLFGFQAIDSFGDTSATIQHFFTTR